MAITWKDFVAGNVLTATEVDDYLMNQALVNVDTVAELTTLGTNSSNKVHVAYVKANDTIYIQDGANAWTPVTPRVTPIFMGNSNASQSVTITTYTPVNLQQETIDSIGGHSTTTNTPRYTPNVAGWYEVSGVVQWQGSASGTFREAGIAKNGTTYVTGGYSRVPMNATAQLMPTPVVLVYLNGTTDYVQMIAYSDAGTNIGNIAPNSMVAKWVSA